MPQTQKAQKRNSDLICLKHSGFPLKLAMMVSKHCKMFASLRIFERPTPCTLKSFASQMLMQARVEFIIETL